MTTRTLGARGKVYHALGHSYVGCNNPVVLFWGHLLWWCWGCFGFTAHNPLPMASWSLVPKMGITDSVLQRQVLVPFLFLIFSSAPQVSMSFPLKLYQISIIRLNPELLFSSCSESEVYPLRLQKDLFICGFFLPWLFKWKEWENPCCGH